MRITRRYFTEPGEPVETEDHHYLTSLSPHQKAGRPEELLRLIREHWDIENRLHHIKDRSLGEDACRNKRGSMAACWLRNIAVALMPYVRGTSAPTKAQNASANPKLVIRLFAKKRLNRCKRHL